MGKNCSPKPTRVSPSFEKAISHVLYFSTVQPCTVSNLEGVGNSKNPKEVLFSSWVFSYKAQGEHVQMVKMV